MTIAVIRDSKFTFSRFILMSTSVNPTIIMIIPIELTSRLLSHLAYSFESLIMFLNILLSLSNTQQLLAIILLAFNLNLLGKPKRIFLCFLLVDATLLFAELRGPNVAQAFLDVHAVEVFVLFLDGVHLFVAKQDP